VTKQAHVIWLDNFTKYAFRAVQIPSFQVGTYHRQLWTGRAYRVSRMGIDMSVRHDEHGEVIPAMPDDLFVGLDEVVQSLSRYSPHKRRAMKRHSRCLLTRYDVRNAPPCPDPDNLETLPHQTAVREHHDSMDNLFPDTILPTNIGQNKGFLRLMRQHYEDNCQEDDCEGARYSVFSTDIDICNKQLRVNFFFVSQSIFKTILI